MRKLILGSAAALSLSFLGSAAATEAAPFLVVRVDAPGAQLEKAQFIDLGHSWCCGRRSGRA